MTTTTISGLELLRSRMGGAIAGQLPGHIERLGWSAGQLATFQRDRLRALLARAIECSPFHAERLRGVDPSRFEGRSDDLFRYAEASVHPFVLGAVLLSAPAIREFQVRQTERGADVAAVIDGDLDQAAVTAALEQSLRQAGLPGPQVRIRRVEALDRDAMTGKARRFIPLHARRAGTT